MKYIILIILFASCELPKDPKSVITSAKLEACSEMTALQTKQINIAGLAGDNITKRTSLLLAGEKESAILSAEFKLFDRQLDSLDIEVEKRLYYCDQLDSLYKTFD